jgi:hypothetical protein
MSAYSASPPVATRNTAPRTRNPLTPLCRKNVTAWAGLTAASTEGSRAIQIRPSPASVPNQRSMTGPNTAPTLAVPRLWNRNRPIRMPIVIGTTYGSKKGVATPSPSTALSTEMAGVIMPSP